MRRTRSLLVLLLAAGLAARRGLVLMGGGRASARENRAGLSNDLAPMPPMGWNSYDSYGGELKKKQGKGNTPDMAGHLGH